jgi:hypothetical protein
MPGDSAFPDARRPDVEPAESVEEILPILRHVVRRPGQAGTYYCQTGYGMVGDGDTVLLAVSDFHDQLVVDGIVRALEEKGAKVDVLTYGQGADRGRRPEDEVTTAITNLEQVGIGDTDLELGTFESKYAEHLGLFSPPKEMATAQGYDLLVQSFAGPLRPTSAHYEGEPYHLERIPWQTTYSLKSAATTYPSEVYEAINEVTYDRIWTEQNKGAEVRITDPEGTDLRFTLLSEYVDSVGDRDVPKDNPEYLRGHISLHPLQTPSADAEMEGVLAGTLAHYNSPFPRIELSVADGRVERIDGGGAYGDLLRELRAYTRSVDYPAFDDTGLLWPFEFAIGTQPKAFRPPFEEFNPLSGTGTLAERLRSGVIHVGVGSSPVGENKAWAIEHDEPYGHVHVHLLFPTVEIHREDGTVVPIIEKGRLSALDDPGVRAVAAKYGDPDELLREDWIPEIPGISADGDYDDYASDPIAYLEASETDRPSRRH